MFSKKELKLAYGLAVCFLVVGVISYAAFPLKPPDEPVRLFFKVTAGNVLFDHKIHASESGYGLSCQDCHHELTENEGERPQPCEACHDPTQGDEEMPKLADAFHKQCAGCHADFGAGPTEKECSQCHVM
jgi:predicted CXXCH cytochrome family protein